MPAPTFTTLRIGETVHVRVQAVDQGFGETPQNVRLAGLFIDTDDAGVATVTNNVSDEPAGRSDADVTGIASGSCNVFYSSGGQTATAGPVNTPVTVLNANAVIVNDAGVVEKVIDSGDGAQFTLTARLVDVRHEAGASSEPNYVGTDWLWEYNGPAHDVTFDNPIAMTSGDPTGTEQTVVVNVGSLDQTELDTDIVFVIDLSAKNSANVTVTGSITIKLRQATAATMVIVPA